MALPLRLGAAGWTTSAIGGLFLAVAATLAVTNAAVGRLSDRRGRSGPIWMALSIGAGGTVVLAGHLAPFTAAAAAAATEVGLGTMLSPAMAWLVDGADARAVPAGVSSGLMNGAWAAGQGSGGIVAGAVLHVAPSVTYVGLGLACAMAAAMVRLGSRRWAGPHEAR